MSEKQLQIGRQTVEVSNLDKVLFPDDGLTKRDLIDYYRRIADVMLPHLRERPLNMQRFPDGIDASGFYEKKVPSYFPDWITTVDILVKEDGSTQPQVVCDSAATLVYLANQACITPHVWLSRVDKLEHPERLILDLDPPGSDFEPVRQAALALHDLLDEVGLVPFVMTTGSRGLHVVAPLKRSVGFDAVRDVARDLMDVLAGRHPEQFTTETRKDKRNGRLFLDYLRNAYGQTAVAPYAIRPKPGAPVATPLDWEELHDRDLHSQRYNVHNIFRRMGQKEDPWHAIRRHARGLDHAIEALKSLN